MNPQPARPKANVTLTRSSRHVSWKPNLAGELLAPGPAAVSARGPEAGPPPRPRCRWRVTGTGLPASAWPLRRSGPCVPFQTWLHEELGAGRGPGHRLGSESAASRGSQGPVLSGSMPGRVLPQGLCICRSLAPRELRACFNLCQNAASSGRPEPTSQHQIAVPHIDASAGFIFLGGRNLYVAYCILTCHLFIISFPLTRTYAS